MPDSKPDDILTDFDLDPNEASGLACVTAPAVLEGFGWDRGFWAVLDEMSAAECVVLLGHRAGGALHEGWTVERLSGRTGDAGETIDAEAVATHDGSVYVFGSHHGGKRGPLKRSAQWIGRFAESEVTRGAGVDLVVADDAFGLHRLLNDALRDSGSEVLEMRDLTRAAFIDATIDELRGTAHEGRVRPDDWAINIEGADFTSGGSLLLGLRFPVTADGRPLVVQVTAWSRLFDEPATPPQVEAIWEVDAVGREGSLAGVRDLCVAGDQLHIVSGDLDSAGKGSVIREDYPGGTQTVATHFVATLPDRGGGGLDAAVVKEFADDPRIEGIAQDADGRFFYVSDEDEYISVRSTPLRTE